MHPRPIRMQRNSNQTKRYHKAVGGDRNTSRLYFYFFRAQSPMSFQYKKSKPSPHQFVVCFVHMQNYMYVCILQLRFGSDWRDWFDLALVLNSYYFLCVVCAFVLFSIDRPLRHSIALGIVTQQFQRIVAMHKLPQLSVESIANQQHWLTTIERCNKSVRLLGTASLHLSGL